MISRRQLLISVSASGLLLGSGVGAQNSLMAQPEPTALPPGTSNGEWRSYGGDVASTRYAPLDQIDQTNFNQLQIAWRFKTDSYGPRPEINFDGTPLMAGGVVYSTVGTRRDVVALDAVTV